MDEDKRIDIVLWTTPSKLLAIARNLEKSNTVEIDSHHTRIVFKNDQIHNHQINADRANVCPHCGGTGGAHQGDCKVFDNL